MKLYTHQKQIIDDDPKYAGLFLGTGSSKTRIALELATGKILVVCPKTQKEDQNWERENKKWDINKNVTVISKETFRRDAHLLPYFDTIIVDEAHTVLGVTPNTRWRNKKQIPRASQVFEALQEYIQKHDPERIYLCTATIMRSPMTVWAAGKILGADWNFYDFRNTFYIRLPMQGREVYAPKKNDTTKKRLAEAVRKLGYVGRLEDYFDVPEQTYKTMYLELTAHQKDLIKQAKIDYIDPIVQVGKVHQIENGVVIGNEFSPTQTFKNAKLDTLVELATEFPRMIVFAKYTAQIELIAQTMSDIDKEVSILTGDTQDRGALLERAKNTKEYVFIAQAQVSAGWELPECPVMVFASMTYSIVDRIQGEGRIQRSNNLKKNLYIDLVVRGGVDEAVYKCSKMKKDFDERLYINNT